MAIGTAETIHYFKCRKCGGVSRQTQREQGGFILVTSAETVSGQKCWHRSWDDSGWNKDELTPEQIATLEP